MTLVNLISFLPLIVVAAAAVFTMLLVAFYRKHVAVAIVTFVGLALALVATPIAATVQGPVTPLFVVDGYAVFYIGLLLVTALVVTVFSYRYLEKRGINPEEYYIVLLVATLGSVALVTSNHFASFFLGLETLSVALYVLIGYLRQSERSIEAGVKYLVLGAVSAAFLLFGMALVYAYSGELAFDRLASFWSGGEIVSGPLILAGVGLIIVGVGFKLAVVPFHMWTPDVYEGAPAPVVAFAATSSKGAMVALLLRFLLGLNFSPRGSLFVALTIISLASMFIGNLLALLQQNVKRIMAGSSIAHLGYILVAVLVSGGRAVLATSLYLLFYFATTLAFFGGLTVLSGPERDADRLEDYRGLFWHRPWLAGMFAVSLFSLAGLPLTAGFIAKFYIVTVGVSSAFWLLVFALIVTSVIGLFYYVRLIVVMFLPREGEKARSAEVSLASVVEGLALALLTVVMLGLGIYPASLFWAVNLAMGSLAQGPF
jgi:NADH-quinone oxidoreductase subunit N